MTPLDFTVALITYCGAMDASVTSYGRTGIHNHEVGGVQGSLHILWMAADVVYDTLPALEHRRQAALHLGLKVVVEKDHDHIQPF